MNNDLLDLTGGRSILGDEKLFALLAAVVRTNALHGIVAEMGVYRGGAARMLIQASHSTVHLFDTFCGLPFDDSNGVHRQGEFAESLEEVSKFLGHSFVSHVGLVPDSIPETMRFRFIHMDLDTYQSTAATLDCVTPKMVEGGIIVMDDWHWESCAGVTKAIEERFGAGQLNEVTAHQVRIQF